jgi:SRSO17 transposase
MIARAIAASVPFKWVAGDTVYGVGDIEQQLRRAGKGCRSTRSLQIKATVMLGRGFRARQGIISEWLRRNLNGCKARTRMCMSGFGTHFGFCAMSGLSLDSSRGASAKPF